MKNFKKVSIPTVLILFSLLLVACSLQATFAANQTINDASDGGIRGGIGNASAGDAVFLQPGTYNKTGNDTNFQINKNITLQGNSSTNNVIIDAQGLSRIFDIGNGYNVTFINITFINGNVTGVGGAGYGGAIRNTYANTAMTFINCTFTNNNVAGTGGGGTGGAIYTNGNISITNCIFTDNNANVTAGAIYTVANATIANCVFSNNNASGGAGGAISGRINGSIVNSTFNNNSASTSGGAINLMSNMDLSIKNCSFTNNTAQSGGVIYTNGGAGLSTIINITNSSFSNNNANGGAGGVIRANNNVTINIISSSFDSNIATSAGGVITLTADCDMYVFNSTFDSNIATNGSGGAISSGQSNISVINSTFGSNIATNGSGGAIFLSSTLTRTATINGSTFTNNKATKNGGAIAIFNIMGLFVSDNTMAGNSAGLGQMIYNNGTIGVLNLIYLSNSTVKTSKGSNVTIYATLTDDMGNTVTGQNISFYVDGVFIANVTSVEGKANATYLVTQDPVSVLPVTGDYVGHEGYSIVLKNGELLILKIATNMTIDVPGNVKVGKNTILKSKLTDKDGNPIVNATVDFYVNGKKVGSVITDENGIAKLNYTFTKAGNYNVQAKYAGNDTYLPSNAATQTKVSKIKTKLTIDINGDEFTVTLTDEDGNPLAGKKVFLKDRNGRVLGWGITDENGQFTFTYAGSNVNFKASFNGDDVYEASSVKFSIGSENTTNTTKSNKNPVGTATMKNTGIPIIAVILVLLASLGLIRVKKE